MISPDFGSFAIAAKLHFEFECEAVQTYLHFGNFGGAPVKVLWVILGLAPSLLSVTGFLMWWNRSLAKKWARRHRESVSPDA